MAIPVSTSEEMVIVIEQCPELWSKIERPRQWQALIMGQTVIVRNNATDLADGEDEYPPTYELTWAEWEQLHETAYGMDLSGARLDLLTERRAAWRKLRRLAGGEAPYDEATVRGAFGAVRRILRDLTPEVEE